MKNKRYFFCICFFLMFLSFQIQAAWKAQWIGTEFCQNDTNTWLNYRYVCDINHLPASAIAQIACDSKYWLWINNRQVVFEGGLKRGPNPRDTYYDEVDIAPFLIQGKNIVTVLVWYFGKQGFSHNSSNRAGLLFDCQTSDFDILSDEHWKCEVNEAYSSCKGPQPNFRLAESSLSYDARKANTNMPYAHSMGLAGVTPWNNLIKRPIPLFKDYGLKKYMKTTRVGDTLLCALPYNAQFTPYLKIKSKAGLSIGMATDNYLFYNGATENIHAVYITRNGIQEYESLGWMNGHQMYYILPPGVEVLEVKYRETGYNAAFSGSFSCSDEFLNVLWKKAARTLYVTMRDNFMDCPDRERAQWTGDAVNQSGESFYVLSPQAHALSAKWLHELIDWQRDDGSLYSPVPSGNWNSELPAQILASIGQYGIWNYYLHTGDSATLNTLYHPVKRYLALWKMKEDHTVSIRKGGWQWGDWGENIDMDLLYNSWYYLALQCVQNMAKELGLKEDVAIYDSIVPSFKEAYNKRFWTGSAYRDPDYRGRTDDRGQALAVVSGLADENKFEALLKIFQTEENASTYMEKYVFEAMMKMGYEEQALERHRKRMATMVYWPGFTTLFEHWSVGVSGFQGGTVNHSWTGGGLTVISQYITGVTPLEPGFKLFSVLPRPGRLIWAKSVVPSIQGSITTSFKNKVNEFDLNVHVPTSTKAVIGAPTKDVKKIRINGVLVWERGVYRSNTLAQPFSDGSKHHILFLVPSGDYKLCAKKLQTLQIKI